MPGADDKKTKYVKDGAYELMQWKSSKGAKVIDGSVSDKRSMEGGTTGAKAEGAKAGDIYTVTFTRKLSGPLAEGKAVPFGVAVHADHSTGRFHHVSSSVTTALALRVILKPSSSKSVVAGWMTTWPFQNDIQSTF